MQQESKMPFTFHLAELRNRLIISLAAVGVGFGLSYNFSEQLFKILSRPLPPDTHFSFIRLVEPFFTYLKVSLLTGIFLASPVLIYQLWAFIAPGLHESEKKWVLPIIFFSIVTKFLLAFGVVFEIPLFILFLSRFGVIDTKMLSAYRKYAILGIFVLAAILTPTPDAFSQILMAAPMMLLYEVGIIVAKVFGKKPAEG